MKQLLVQRLLLFLPGDEVRVPPRRPKNSAAPVENLIDFSAGQRIPKNHGFLHYFR
jgi:hypothetical protein